MRLRWSTTGHSYLDTGNNNKVVRSWKFPYGITFPGTPTGRYSNGLIFTDLLASYIGIESPMPYTQWNKSSKRTVSNGMNFAHGATGVFDTWMKEANMTTQINTFKQFVPEQYIADGVYNKCDLEQSVAIVALDGNDYTQYYLVDNGTKEGFQAYVVKVLHQLELNLRELGKTGIKKVVMLTMEPLGCLPNKAISLSYKKCDEQSNKETIFHNTLLQQIIQRLRNETNDSPFHILDLYGAFMYVINKTAAEGTPITGSAKFRNPLLKPCCRPTSPDHLCGGVNDNGVKQYTLCDHPDDYFFWDFYHPTQSGWRAILSYLKPSLDEFM
ncbi:hypothetical protein MKW94_000951 [Papaver nudicaule]|uniref:GDSL esterase/lipase n=1 Tax=Papaver nudicaule TaxID=74823 RepID=A0AA41S678_PAPNU|nr:hypothetical protein [Papaver nudicaule]